MSTEKLQGQALLEMLDKPETRALENNEDKVRLAGYNPDDPIDQGQFVLQLKKAQGWEPKFIKGNGDDWRTLQLSVSNAFAVGYRLMTIIEDTEDEDKKSMFAKMLDNVQDKYKQYMKMSADYVIAYLHHTLRVKTFTDYHAQSSGNYSAETIKELSKTWFPGVGEAMMLTLYDTENVEHEYEAANTYNRYIALTNYIFLNEILNTVDGGNRPIVDDQEMIDGFKSYHHDFEEIGRYDDIFIIRTMVQECILADTPLFMDEGKSRTFREQAGEIVRKYDTKITGDRA